MTITEDKNLKGQHIITDLKSKEALEAFLAMLSKEDLCPHE